MENKAFTKYNIQRDLRKDSINLVPKHNFRHHKEGLILFVYPNLQRISFRGLTLVGIMGVLLGGCGGDQTRSDQDAQFYADQSSAVFAPDPEDTPSPELGLDDEEVLLARENIGGWSIVLSKVGRTGNQGMRRAQEMLEIVQDQAGLKEAKIEQRSTGLVIAYGDYLGKADPQAIRDLKKIQQIEINGVKIFEQALITPPTSKALRGSNPSYDLRTVKQRFGDAAIYTLQIGIYGRADYQMPSAQDLAAFRKAAEDAVRVLRAQGEMAFYYHAPARSMVTVGVFGERDFDATTKPPTQSRELRELRERFPNNLLNGQGINEKIRSESGHITRLQSSQLVSIPEK